MTDVPFSNRANEAGRLAALRSYEILDTPPERDFDHLVNLASRIFSVPVALVSLIDDKRQFLKARIGVDVCEAGRDVSFCTHAIRQNRVMYVLDAQLDPRFANNPFVAGEPNIRFYAGAPLVTPSGHAIGTLCIVDDKPRESFSDEEQRTLQDLASLVIDRLEMRRLNLQRTRNEDALVQMAHFDDLTELPNRASLWRQLDEALMYGGPVTVLLIDVDGFKTINDTMGHLFGNEVLKCLAKRIRETVPESMFVARPTGDEFVVVIEDSGDPLRANALASMLVDEIARPCVVDGRPLQLGVSVGVAIAPQHGVTAQELLANADIALCRAKAEGRGRSELFTPSLLHAIQSKRSCEAELQRAFDNNEFELVYQPQVRLEDCALAGAEALLRWRHPERGILAPAAFLPVLETMPLAMQVGEWTIRTACRHASEWHAAEIPLQIAVNLFGVQFTRSADLVGVVKDALTKTGLPASQLELEITENIILRHEAGMTGVLKELRKLDVGIAFDDYGTGYASLSQLKRFPLTKLKIDQSFVRGLCTDPADAAVVDAILHLGQNFGFQVVAEGVEQLEQHDRLVTRGCAWGQGFLYGRPMPVADFSRRVNEWREVA